jgi:AcrR family transcriptional regulator
MGRPPRHDADHLLAVAGRLAADGGPASVTMSAVARAAGAPSGSVYHRFPSRPALLAALFVGTVERFQEGFLAALTDPDPVVAAASAARHVVAWSRADPEGTAVLHYGARDFQQAGWPPAEQERLTRANRRVARAVRDLAARLGDTSAYGLDRTRLATMELPYSVVRRHRGRPLPRHAEALAADAASALLNRA